MTATGQARELRLQRRRSRVRETVRVHHRFEGRVAEDAGTFIARLGVLGDRADFDVTKSQGCRPAPPEAILVEPRCQADVVGEF